MPRTDDERTITEQQFQREVNSAIADTEIEILQDAMGDQPLDNDGDRSLEEMGEGLEGDELDDEDEDREDRDGDEDDDDEDGERQDDRYDDRSRRRDDRDVDDRDARRHESARQDDERVNARRREREERGDDDNRRGDRDRGRGDDRDERGRVPSWRLREESQRRGTAQQEAEELRARLAISEARLNDLNARMNTPARTAAEAEPDMFADPEGWKTWNTRQVEARAAAITDQRLNAFRQETQEQQNNRVNVSFNDAANTPGLTGMEFHAAYQALTSLDNRDPRNRATVAKIYHASDPAEALADWFEKQGYAREFRQDLRDHLDGGRRRARSRNDDDDNRPRGRQRQNDDYERDDQRREPRREFRRRFVPSLNSAVGGGGGGAGRNHDPEAYDNTDAAVMRYAMR